MHVRYSYRLAPADKPLTEEQFRKMPLDFVGPGILRWGGNVSSQLEFNATRTTEGTFPAGSMWSRNPIPRFVEQWEDEGPAFEPVCQESKACTDLATSCASEPCFQQGECRCSGAPRSLRSMSFPAVYNSRGRLTGCGIGVDRCTCKRRNC